jgi:peptidoglycan hydrolase CwlO-like protein
MLDDPDELEMLFRRMARVLKEIHEADAKINQLEQEIHALKMVIKMFNEADGWATTWT